MSAGSQFGRAFTWVTLVAAVGVAGCFDTRTIPPADDTASSNAGAGGKRPTAGSGGGTAGKLTGQGGDDTATTAGTAGSGASPVAGAGAGNVPSVTWLTLQGSQAPSTESTNAELGINGSFYAYADECATLTWDEATRCASGTVCPVGANFENWGVAVGFDFNATGSDGEPPDSKLVWNPDKVGARGVTWRIRGTAPSRQVWVLNMQPSFRGQCNIMTCEIAGPPDGTATPGLEGELLFAHMVKDNWGGGGTPYVYDPAAVFALQFKLPAINIDASSARFDFCIEALGVVR